MQVIFISGPYRADTLQGVMKNIQRARSAALKLWKQGYAVICPHSNTALFDGAADDSVWLKGYLEILKRCDAIYMLKGWEKSEGSRAEYHEAAGKLEVIFE